MSALINLAVQAGLAVCLLAASVQAQASADPTRPPDALNPALVNAAGSPDTGPVLQSVLISRGRKVAIIGGKEVRLNDKYGDARVIKITETEVVLRRGKDVKTLKLFPDVEKHKVGNASRKKTDKRQHEKVQ